MERPMRLPKKVIFLFIQYAVPLLYASLVLFFKVLPRDGSYVQIVWLVLGFYLGYLLLWVDDRWLYQRYNPLQTLPKHLITRSVLFALTLMVLLIFVITSSGSVLGVGMVLGVALKLSLEQQQLRQNPEAFHQTFLFQLKRRMTDLEIKRMLVIFNAVLGIAALYFLFK